MLEGLLPRPSADAIADADDLDRKKGLTVHESPLHCLTAHNDHDLTALGILWNDVCDRYACCKRSSGGELQVF